MLGVEDLTRPWATGVRTSLVTLEDGRRVVHQEGAPTAAGRAGIARRIRFARALRSAAPELPVPDVLDGDARANPPFAVTSYLPGEPGDALLATPPVPPGWAAWPGARPRPSQQVPPAALGRSLPRTWANPDRLAAAAAGWLREAGAFLDQPEAEAVRAVLDRIPMLLATPPVVAHGDLAPVNLLVEGERLAGILDLERLRLAPATLRRRLVPAPGPSPSPGALAGRRPPVAGGPRRLRRRGDGRRAGRPRRPRLPREARRAPSPLRRVASPGPRVLREHLAGIR